MQITRLGNSMNSKLNSSDNMRNCGTSNDPLIQLFVDEYLSMKDQLRELLNQKQNSAISPYNASIKLIKCPSRLTYYALFDDEVGVYNDKTVDELRDIANMSDLELFNKFAKMEDQTGIPFVQLQHHTFLYGFDFVEGNKVTRYAFEPRWLCPAYRIYSSVTTDGWIDESLEGELVEFVAIQIREYIADRIMHLLHRQEHNEKVESDI